jgi:hypothetical protein
MYFCTRFENDLSDAFKMFRLLDGQEKVPRTSYKVLVCQVTVLKKV